MATIRTDAWLIIEPVRAGYSGQITGLELSKMLKTKPRLGVREVGVHIILEVESDIFQTPEPDVTIRIDDKRALVVPQIEVETQEEAADVEGLDTAGPAPEA